MSVHAAESLDLPQGSGETMPDLEKLGPGKRKRKPNTLYRAANFWRHNDIDGSDVEAEEWDATCKRCFFWHQLSRQLKAYFFTLQNLIEVDSTISSTTVRGQEVGHPY
jgi:hypothetical protein